MGTDSLDSTALSRATRPGRLIAASRYLNGRFPRAYWLATFIPRLTAAMFWLRRIETQGIARRLSDIDFSKKKTSDTVFILATGSSINQYPRTHWETIARHDSIGMNFFMLHDFVPDIYVMENMEERHRTLLAMKSEEYADVPLLLKNALSNLSPRRVRERVEKMSMNEQAVRSRQYLSLDFFAAGGDVRTARRAYELMKSLGFFTVKPRFLFLTKRRGSISYIINLAARIGYKEIVLCGVDLNHSEYFYDSKRAQLERSGYPVPPNNHVRDVHLTNDPEWNPVTIKDVIEAINDVVLKPSGIQLYVGHHSSALHPVLPEYPWGKVDQPRGAREQ